MDKQMYFGLATLILGWLLGIFSNIILNRSKRKSTKMMLKREFVLN